MKPNFLKYLCLFVLTGFLQSQSKADTILTNPTEQQFANALAAGGRITVSGNTILILTNSYTLQKNTLIDAEGSILEIKIGHKLITVPANLSLGLRGVVIQNCGMAVKNGGAFYNQGTLALTNCYFKNNNLGPSEAFLPNQTARGGLIYNSEGTLKIENCVFSGNMFRSSNSGSFAPLYGGVIYDSLGEVTISNSRFANNFMGFFVPGKTDAGAACYGGAVYSSGYCKIDQCVFDGNLASGAGGIAAYNGLGRGAGGAIYSDGMLVVTNSTLANNSTVTASYDTKSVGGAIGSSGRLLISYSKISGNNSANGGAIYSEGLATLDHVSILQNTGKSGAGLYNLGTMKLTSTTLDSNVANGLNEYAQYKSPYEQGPIVLAGKGKGGGVYNAGEFAATNSTFFGNKAAGGNGTTNSGSGMGGAIYSQGTNPVLTLVHATLQSNLVFAGSVVSNAVAGSSSGSALWSEGTLTVLANSIISGGNTNGVIGGVADYGGNICFDGTANLNAPGSYNGQDAKLGAFGNNGGFTRTAPLLPDSLAVDHANPTFVPREDQRGITRDRNSADIGAFEAMPVAVTVPTLNSTNYPALFPGDIIHLTGLNLFYATNVSIAGVSAEFNVISDSEITVVVPGFFESSNFSVKTATGITGLGPIGRPWLEIQSVSVSNRALVVMFMAATNGVVVKQNYGYANTREYSQSQTANASGMIQLNFPITNILASTFVAELEFTKDLSSQKTEMYTLNFPLPRIQFSDWQITYPSSTSANIQVRLDSELDGLIYILYGPATNSLQYLGPWDRQATNGIHYVNFAIENLVPGRKVYVETQFFNGQYINYLVSSEFHELVPPIPFRDQSISFSTKSQYVSVGHKSALNAMPLTISTWFKTTQKSGYVGLVSKYDPTIATGYQISIIDGTLHAFYLKDSLSKISEGQEGIVGGDVADGAWHHVDFVAAIDGGKLYVDGMLKSDTAWTGTPGPTTSAAPLRFGYYFNGFVGELDEVELWNKAKTASEVSHYRTPPNRADPQLLGYWKFNEGSGSLASDETSNGNDGVINGAPGWIASGAPFDRNVKLLLDGNAGLSVIGKVAANFVLDESTDLANWIPASTNQFNGTGSAAIPISPTGPKKFFRIRSP